MNLASSICRAFEPTFASPENVGTFLLFAIPIVISGFVAISILRSDLILRQRIVSALLVTPLVFAAFFVICFLVDVFVFNDWLRASNYFQLNAAIKNTCYLDSRRAHCPQNLDQLIAIQDENFQPLKHMLIYKYYPDTNQYTLIVHDHTYGAVVFDPRLKNTNGEDFAEFQVSKCGGDHIINPPNFPGPWDLKSN
jgi:hypothetical protein